MKNTSKTHPFASFSRSITATLLAAGFGGLLMGTQAARAGYDVLPAQTQPAGGNIVIVDMNDRLKFVPNGLRVKVGDTVEWRNIGSYPHTITADPGLASNRENIALPAGIQPFSSKRVRANQTYRYTFAKAGTYRYVCLPHEGAGMLGTVIVE